MGTKKQTMRNRVLAFAVVMVYALALLPSFAFAVGSNVTGITGVTNGTTADSIGAIEGSVDTANNIIRVTTNYGEKKAKVAFNMKSNNVISNVGGGSLDDTTKTAITVENIPAYNEPRKVVTFVADEATPTAGTENWKLEIRQAEPKHDATLSTLTDNSSLTWTKQDGTSSVTVDKDLNEIAYATVPYTTVELDLTVTATDPNAKIVVKNGNTTLDNNKLDKIALNVGNNSIVITVTAEDGSTESKKYLSVTRTAADKTNTLKNLSVKGNEDNAKELITFSPNTTIYNVTLDEKTTVLNIAATKLDGSNVTVTGDGSFNVFPGTTPVYYVTVTPEDSNYSKTVYTINVTVPGQKNDASLKDLVLKQDEGRALEFSPKFDTNTVKYSSKIADQTTEIWVKKDILSDKNANAKFTINNSAATMGTPVTFEGEDYHVIEVPNSGATANAFLLNINVTAANQATVKTYQVSVNRLPKSDDASVKNIAFSGAWTKDKFNEATTTYAGTAAAETFQVTVNTGHPFAKIELTDKTGTNTIANGVATDVTLPTGNTNVLIKVTAEDASSDKTYTYVFNVTDKMYKPALTSASTTETTATINYIAPKGMDKVAAYYSADGTKWVCGGIVNAGVGSITVKGLQPGTEYAFKVTAGKELYSGQMSYIPLNQIQHIVRYTKAMNMSDDVRILTTDDTSIVVGYSTVLNADGYALYVKEAGATKWAYAAKAGAKGGALTAKNLDSNKKYDIAFTSGQIINGKMVYMPLKEVNQDPISLNTTKLPINVKAYEQLVSGDKVVITYQGVSGYDKYAIYVSDKADGAYKYATVTSDPSKIVVPGLEAGKTYFFKLTVGKNVNGKLVYTPLAEIKDVITVTPVK